MKKSKRLIWFAMIAAIATSVAAAGIGKSAIAFGGVTARAEETLFVPAPDTPAFSVEEETADGARTGLLLQASGGRGTIADAIYRDGVPAQNARLRLDLGALGLSGENGAEGYFEITLDSGAEILRTRVVPAGAGGAEVSVYVGEEALNEPVYVALSDNGAGSPGILCFAVAQTPNLLDPAVMDWNFACNTFAYDSLADYTGPVPPRTSKDRRLYAAGRIKTFLDASDRVRLGVRMVNEAETVKTCAVKVEQVADAALYDVRAEDNRIFVREDDRGYQKLTLRWTVPEDGRVGGILLDRYDDGVLRKSQPFATAERYAYQDDGLSQRVSYRYELSLVDDVTLPVPKVYYRFAPFETKSKQGSPGTVIGVIAGVLAACALFVIAFTYYPKLRAQRSH